MPLTLVYVGYSFFVGLVEMDAGCMRRDPASGLVVGLNLQRERCTSITADAEDAEDVADECMVGPLSALSAVLRADASRGSQAGLEGEASRRAEADERGFVGLPSAL
jgi:hypothetical protein